MHQTKLVRSVKDDHFLLIKATIHQEDITIVNIYTSNIGAPNFIRQTLLDIKALIDSNTIILADFNIPHSPIDRLSRPKKKNQQRNIRIK
jgi:hypothetical protein